MIRPPGMLLGGIATKLGVVDGSGAIREYFGLTVNFDHDIVDGAPAARFVRALTDLLERGEVLEKAAQGH